MPAQSEPFHCQGCCSVSFNTRTYIVIGEKHYCPDCQPPPPGDRPVVPLSGLSIRPALAAADHALSRLGHVGRAQALRQRFEEIALTSNWEEGRRIILEYVQDDRVPSSA